MRLHIVTVSHDHRLSVVVPAAALGAAIAVDSLPIGVKQSINPKQHSEVTFIARKVVFFMPIDGCLWTVGVSGGQWCEEVPWDLYHSFKLSCVVIVNYSLTDL